MSKKTQLYTGEQRRELVSQWKSSGKTKKAFCEERGLKYHTFVCWKENHDQSQKGSVSSFVPITLRDEASAFAQLILPGGVVLNICQRVDASYLSALLK